MQVEHPQGCEKTLYLRISFYDDMSGCDLRKWSLGSIGMGHGEISGFGLRI